MPVDLNTTGYSPSETDMPFHRVGGIDAVKRIADRFYDHMNEDEPTLARLHPVDAYGHVLPEVRERFTLFLIGWMGGPQDYMEKHGHPRLRMRHARVPVGVGMRDAWLRCMKASLDDEKITGPVRGFLDERFAHVANFLRNIEERA